MPETSEYKHYKTKFTFPMNLVLSENSTDHNKQYELFGIIAYADMHFVAFAKRNE